MMANRREVRVFSIEEANQAIRDLRKTLPALRKVLREIERMERRLEVLGLICNRTVASDNPDLQEYLKLKVRYHRRITEFEGLLSSMDTQGYLLRDLEKGVVHFLGRRGKEGVLLCWKEGEKNVSHWHAIEKNRLPEEANRREIESWDEF
jgi:hypothetical protein